MRFALLISFILLVGNGYAQKRKRTAIRRDPFLQTQWYLGFYGGGNLSSATPTTAYFGYAPLNYNVSSIEKTYDDYSNFGGQYGLVFMFYTRGITVSLKPGFSVYGIQHFTTTTWTDSNDNSNTFEVSYNHTTKLNYLEFPLTIQYDLRRGKLRPYIGGGAYYGMLLNAYRTIDRSGVDAASGAESDFTNQSTTIGIDELFIKSSIGLVGFVGASYDPGNIRITLDVGYKYGLSNITNTKNRFLKNDLAAIGDAADDLQLQHIYFTLGVVFPLKFISKNYSAGN
jgi:hypothetical protein